MGRTNRFVKIKVDLFFYFNVSISIIFKIYFSVGHDEFCQMKKTDDKIIDKIQTQWAANHVKIILNKYTTEIY